jgi:predicted TIM-barrel fold metal-dependent hydrolase
MHRVRIDHSDLTDAEKRLILHDNAARLFGLAAAEPGVV